MATRWELAQAEMEIDVVLQHIEDVESYLRQYQTGKPRHRKNREVWESLHRTVHHVRDRLNSLAAQLDHALNGPGDGPQEKY